jgi:hypothetical protein
MKRILILNFLLLSLTNSAQNVFPSLQSGVYIHTLITNINYTVTPYCNTMQINSNTFVIDQALFDMVTGIRLMYIVTGLPPLPDSAYVQTGTLQIGDTLFFDQGINEYNLTISSSGIVSFDFILSGTPSIQYEYFPCAYDAMVTQSLCGNTYILQASPFDSCYVDGFNKLYMLASDDVFHVSIDYSDVNKVVLRKTQQSCIVLLYDIYGKEIHNCYYPEGLNNIEIYSENLKPGIYILTADDLAGNKFTGKFVIP